MKCKYIVEEIKKINWKRLCRKLVKNVFIIMLAVDVVVTFCHTQVFGSFTKKNRTYIKVCLHTLNLTSNGSGSRMYAKHLHINMYVCLYTLISM